MTMTNTTRRAALAGAAAIPALAIPAIATAAPTGDAELLALVAEYLRAEEEYERVSLQCSRLEDAHMLANPKPEALRIREEDRTILALAELYSFNYDHDGFYGPVDISALRDAKWPRYERLGPSDEFTIRMTYVEPPALARARADEIVRAYDDRQSRRDTPNAELEALKLQHQEALNRTSELADMVSAMPATTIEGLVAKAKSIPRWAIEDEQNHRILHSIVRDLTALRGVTS